MSPAPPRAAPGGNAALALLAATAFVFGTTEFIIVGVLDLVARDLGVSVAEAGQLVMAYALGISIGGPLLSAAAANLPRKALLMAAIAVFALANAVMGVATQHGLLLAARFVPGCMHGLFVGVASTMAARLVPPGQAGRAMSLVFGGIAVATVAGVPLGTWLAQWVGWRMTFGAVVVMAVVALGAAWRLLPAGGPAVEPAAAAGGAAQRIRAAFAPPVLAMLAVGMLLMGGQFSAYTYITPYLKGVTGATDGTVSLYLLVYGGASAVGMFAGGALADRGAERTLVAANGLLLAILAALYAVGSSGPLTALVLAAWGLVGFGLIPSLQLRVVRLAGPGAELAATLSASAINVGIAGGSLIGGQALGSYGLQAVPVTALLLCAVALPLTWASRYLRPPLGA